MDILRRSTTSPMDPTDPSLAGYLRTPEESRALFLDSLSPEARAHEEYMDALIHEAVEEARAADRGMSWCWCTACGTIAPTFGFATHEPCARHTGHSGPRPPVTTVTSRFGDYSQPAMEVFHAAGWRPGEPLQSTPRASEADYRRWEGTAARWRRDNRRQAMPEDERTIACGW